MPETQSAAFSLAELLRDSNYKLTQFAPARITALEKSVIIKNVRDKETPYIKCLLRDKEIKLTPEEAVRQLYLARLHFEYGYPLARMEAEYGVSFGREKKRADIVIFDKQDSRAPYIIVELKKPKLKDGKEQLKSYCNATGAPIGVWSNGDSISYYHRKDPNFFEDISAIPKAAEKLSDILTERWTIADLVEKDKLVNERKSLKDLILEMEDEVLANAGVDVFEELFKLIFTKLYDELSSGRNKSRHLSFRNYGDTDTELKEKIQSLFNEAKKKWEGVFSNDSKIQLTPSHLSVCVSSLQDVKLFNSNLDVVDEAFEYLINKSSKGEKGQYFTPRYVIDMAVKMLDPSEHETIIDTAAGSCGFPVHTIFHVWEKILRDEGLAKSHLFTSEKKPVRCEDYVNEKVFAIDFDERAVRVSRTLNLIAGDGQTNVLHLNTLDWERWSDKTSDEEWIDTYHQGWKRLKKLRAEKDSDRDFNFDIVMANPPFAGDIKESRILSKYDLGKKASGKYQSKVGRDLLFIERNLDFLKPSGRMAVVLPQGRFNNSSDKQVREYIAEKCRILAVVGLHGNVFKPHTGTKTSVLLVQKWDDKLCPKKDDYPIFFATMQEPSKDNSGEKIFVKKKDLPVDCQLETPGDMVPNDPTGHYNETPADLECYAFDSHDHLIVKHDLFNHDGLPGRHRRSLPRIRQARKTLLRPAGKSLSPFNEAKYMALLEGLEISEINLSKLERTKRIDAEFFRKIYLVNLSNLKKHALRSISQVADISDGNHFSISSDFIDEGIPYYRGQDTTGQFFAEQSNPIGITEGAFNQKHMLRSHLRKGDVLLSIVGTVGSLALIASNRDASCSCKLAIFRPTAIAPEILAIYLQSKSGALQIQQYRRGTVQTGFLLEDTDQVWIPDFTKAFSRGIVDLVQQSRKLLEKSAYAKRQSEQTLLQALGLENWQPPNPLTYEASAASAFTSNRLDAEFFNSKYDAALDALRTAGAKSLRPLGDFLKSLTNGHTPLRHNLSEGDVPFICSEHVQDFEVDLESSKRILTEHHKTELKRTQLKNNDILLTIKGRVGNAAIVEGLEGAANINQDVALLRMNKELPHWWIISFLNSRFGKLMTEKYQTGQINPFLSLGTIRTLPIPVFEDKLMQEVGQEMRKLVLESRTAAQKSKALLERAKRTVEIAIEQSESDALTYLNTDAE